MPCNSGPSWAEDPANEVNKVRKSLNNEKAANATLESLLCSAARALDRLYYDFDENPLLSEWWDKHKKADLARIEKERVAAERERWERETVTNALKKPFDTLSAEEKALLKNKGYFA